MPHLEPLSDELLSEAVEALKRANGNKQHAADALGLKVSTYKARLKIASRRGYYASHPAMPGFEIVGITTKTDAEGNVTGQHIREKPEQDRAPFSLPEGHAIKGVSALLDANGDVQQQWVKTKQGELDPIWIAERIRDVFEGMERRAEPEQPPSHADEDLATVFPIADAHYGLYAWKQEAGADYDLTIADDTNREAFGRLIASTPSSGTAVILGLGDLLHADDTTNRTARSGNALDVDTRHAKVLQTAAAFMIHAVDAARQKHGRVIVRNLPGNHDTHSAQAVTLALWAWYRDEPRVEVDTSPAYFWWWQFGKNLIGATHGDMAKMQDLPLIMASSCSEAWGATKYRTVLTGHIHHKSALEAGGVVVESFQSPAARDAWHEASGYRSGRSLTAITYHTERGEIARQKVNL